MKLFLILFLLFIVQGTVMTVFSPEWFGYHIPMIPHFIMVTVLFIAFFVNRGQALKYGIIFGFMIDLVYTTVLGVYAFCIGLTAYILSYLTKAFHMNIYVVLFVCMFGVSLLELEVYSIYSLIGMADQSFSNFVKWRLPPTAILNGVFAVIVFYPLRRFLETVETDSSEE
ncbi:rod shape-determining protein MreD [Scopulibacillus darangshiensis]|uniref:rod shape-determining protein MreD n=1 Tax=Scopulibacillus darangshiensis TaxID=442528 RepID=UPI001FB2C530|nr:rod shape-determining protein MreD [Scopulibacillus darangshiensis]